MPDVANEVAGSWSFPWVPVCALILTAAIYLRGWLRVSRLAPARLNHWRLFAFFGGLFCLFLATCSPLDTFDSLLLQVHMIQHLLLMMVAPALILLGSPYLPLLLGLPRTVSRDFLGPFLAWRPLKRTGRFLTHPVVAWILYVTSTILWHLPYFYELTLRSPGWHQFEHACFFFTAILFWWPVILPWPSRAQWPRWATIPYLLLADVQNTALSAILSFSDRVIYPYYASIPHFPGMNALSDQSVAGAIMWVPGSIAYLIPAGVIAMSYLSPRRHFEAPAPIRRLQRTARKPTLTFDLLRVPIGGKLLQTTFFRRTIQIGLFALAVAICWDGWFGPAVGPMNLAGVLPWTHWRGLTVLAILTVGNIFCFGCPLTFARDLIRKVVSPRWEWPRWLRNKWLAVVLIVTYLWSYEAFSLWNSPALTAWLITGYFGAIVVIDSCFRGASFCKYVCPIGQFHFLQSLISPFEIRVRNPDVCRSCRTLDCIRGNTVQRGCELELFQPRKAGNLDCTFCLDCARACPHQNVGWSATPPARDTFNDGVHSSIGRFAYRFDLGVLALVLVFGAFVNAGGMTLPIERLLEIAQVQLGLVSRPVLLLLVAIFTLVVVPLGAAFAAAQMSSAFGRWTTRPDQLVARFAIALVPLGASMWLAHFGFHLFTGSHTFLPVFQRVFGVANPNWAVGSWSFPQLLDLEFLALDVGLLVTLYACWRIARGLSKSDSQAALAGIPWAVVAICLFAAGIWIIFQPMEMRGMFAH
jgi:cytochrome c oxidase assembly factor CtaG